MRILIDLQGAQTQSRFRGIGRYSLSLVKALLKCNTKHEIYIALNGTLKDACVEVKEALQNENNTHTILYFESPSDIAAHNPLHENKAKVAAYIREFALNQVRPDIILITSLFEGFVDDAITSIGHFTSASNVAVIVYDLIPLLDEKNYLPLQTQKTYYHQKIEDLKKAGFFLAISESTHAELIEHLNVLPSSVATISSAVDDALFQPLTMNDVQKEILKKTYAIQKEFILYAPGGFDARKNIGNLLKAYALLPLNLKQNYQLVIASKCSEDEKNAWLLSAKKEGLASEDLVLTGYVPDEDLVGLYTLAKLFVFPSLHEGFGLPLLEAMKCATPVIGSNTTSIPEVIGNQEALFDPLDPKDIASKMEHVLLDETFRKKLIHSAQEQSKRFSWDISAQKLLVALEKWHTQKCLPVYNEPLTRPLLAYISPLPPDKTGISGYSVELLEALSQWYEIVLVYPDPTKLEKNIASLYSSISSETFLQTKERFDRILYHFGNSTFHAHMFDMLKMAPGIVVLHDFFLSHIIEHRCMAQGDTSAYLQTLYRSHGFKAVYDFHKENKNDIPWHYPCNEDVINHATHIIVHSHHAKELLNTWYEAIQEHATHIPLCRKPPAIKDKQKSRQKCAIAPDAFVVCSFGLIEPSKLTHVLIEAWHNAKLSKEQNARLILVGKNHSGDYGETIISLIKKYHLESSIIITGWVSDETFTDYLCAADIGVQLRTNSRGETSATLLDCLNYALPTIVNAHGSMAEFSQELVYQLPNEVTAKELAMALDTLHKDPALAHTYSEKSLSYMCNHHTPTQCARQYKEVIEAHARQQLYSYQKLLDAVAKCAKDEALSGLKHYAKSIAASKLKPVRHKQIFIDVSAIRHVDLKTGIQRVVRSQIFELMRYVPHTYRIEPVYMVENKEENVYIYARSYMRSFLELDHFTMPDTPIEIYQGDIFYGLDLCANEVQRATDSGLYTSYKAKGAKIYFAVYDLLPILQRRYFPEYLYDTHTQWLSNITSVADGLICISQTVADEVTHWVREHQKKPSKTLKVTSAHLGADLAHNAHTPIHFSEYEHALIQQTKTIPTFLMVGTIEPRKGHLQTLKAFDLLWEKGIKCNLVIIGKSGWMVDETTQHINNHPSLHTHLFWLNPCTDELLEAMYQAAHCLIAASEGEGFGLPLIEAAHHGIPIVARDIPVFKEVASEYAFYFPNDLLPQTVASSIQSWLELYEKKEHPSSKSMPYITWEENARRIFQCFQ